MIRRFVNIVAENHKSGMYSLHRLDVLKHLFYPSAEEAEKAAAEVESKEQSGGWAPQIPSLNQLPPPSMFFRPNPTTLWGKPVMEFFGLLSPSSSESRIICSSDTGNTVLYNTDLECLQCMPSLQGGFIGRKPPITISTGPPGAAEEDFFLLHPGERLSRFHVLRFGHEDRMMELGGRMGWHWESLPPLPFGGIINSHALIDHGRTICVSSTPGGFGTYCFDTVEREWWKAGDWVLPFEGGAKYIPDLNLWLGFSLSRPHHLCATSDLLHLAVEKQPESRCDMPYLYVNAPDEWSTLRLDLLNLGKGKFCVVEILEIVHDTRDSGSEDSFDWDAIDNDFALFTGVELVTSGAHGDRREWLRIHKSKRYIFSQDQIQWVM